MAFEKPEIRDSIRSYLQDDGKFLGAAEIDIAISDAIRQFNHDKSLIIVKDITGDGTQDYDLPDDFKKGFSDIISVEHPADENPPVLRQRDDDWFVYEDPTKSSTAQLRLRFKESTPTSSETIRVTMMTTHTVNETSSTLNQSDFMGVVYKTLNLLFLSLSARFSQAVESTITADGVDRQGQVQNFLFMAERFETRYRQISGAGDGVKAAQALGEIDIRFSHGEDFIWHPTRTR